MPHFAAMNAFLAAGAQFLGTTDTSHRRGRASKMLGNAGCQVFIWGQLHRNIALGRIGSSVNQSPRVEKTIQNVPVHKCRTANFLSQGRWEASKTLLATSAEETASRLRQNDADPRSSPMFFVAKRGSMRLLPRMLRPLQFRQIRISP